MAMFSTATYDTGARGLGPYVPIEQVPDHRGMNPEIALLRGQAYDELAAKARQNRQRYFRHLEGLTWPDHVGDRVIGLDLDFEEGMHVAFSRPATTDWVIPPAGKRVIRFDIRHEPQPTITAKMPDPVDAVRSVPSRLSQAEVARRRKALANHLRMQSN